MKSKYDVVILGAGHNGLVAAAYLARAGVERSPFGMLICRSAISMSAETQKEAPKANEARLIAARGQSLGTSF